MFDYFLLHSNTMDKFAKDGTPIYFDTKRNIQWVNENNFAIFGYSNQDYKDDPIVYENTGFHMSNNLSRFLLGKIYEKLGKNSIIINELHCYLGLGVLKYLMLCYFLYTNSIQMDRLHYGCALISGLTYLMIVQHLMIFHKYHNISKTNGKIGFIGKLANDINLFGKYNNLIENILSYIGFCINIYMMIYFRDVLFGKLLFLILALYFSINIYYAKYAYLHCASLVI